MPPSVSSTSLIARRSKLWHAVGRSGGVVQRLRWGHALGAVCEDMKSRSHTRGGASAEAQRRPSSAPSGKASRSRRRHDELQEKLQLFLRRRESLSGAGLRGDRGKSRHDRNGVSSSAATASQRVGLEQRLARYTARASPAAQNAVYSPNRGRSRGAEIEISQHAYGTGLNYGAEIALESSQGWFLQIAERGEDPNVTLEVTTAAKQIKSATRFTIYSTTNPGSLGEVRYGDCVRLELCSVRRLQPETSRAKRTSQLLGVRIDGKHTQLQDQAGAGQKGAARWAPAPMVLPESRNSVQHMGRWVVRHATGLAQERADSVVHCGQIVLEQDWGYLSSSNDPGQMVEIRQRGDPDVGVFKSERELPKLHSGGVWKVHLCSALTTKVGRKRQALLEARKQIQSVQDGAAEHRRFPVRLNQNRQNYKQKIASRQIEWEVAKEAMFQDVLHDKSAQIVAKKGASVLSIDSTCSSPTTLEGRQVRSPCHTRSRSPALEPRTQRLMGVITEADAVAHLSTLGGGSKKYADGTMARETLAGLGLTDPYSFSVLERAARDAVKVRMGSQLVDLPHTVAGRRATAAKLIQRTYRRHMDKPLLRKFLQEDIDVARELLNKNKQIERQRADALALEEERKLNVMRSSGMNKGKQGGIRVTHR